MSGKDRKVIFVPGARRYGGALAVCCEVVVRVAHDID